MDTYDLDTAFYKKLEALSFSGTTVKSGVIFDPKVATTWRRGTVILGPPEPVGFGNGVYSRVEGTYQIDIYVTQGTDGAFKVLKKAADAHVTHFFPANGRGQTLVENTTSAHIIHRPNQLPFGREGAYLRETVEVEFYVEIPAVG